MTLQELRQKPNKNNLKRFTDGNFYAETICAKPWVLRIRNLDRKIVENYMFDATGKDSELVTDLYNYINSFFDFDKLENEEYTGYGPCLQEY